MRDKKQDNCQRGHDAREKFLPLFAEWLNDEWLGGAVALVRARAEGGDTARLIIAQREIEPLFLKVDDWDGEDAEALADAFNFDQSATTDAWERFLSENDATARRWSAGGYILADLKSADVQRLEGEQRALVAAVEAPTR